MILEKYIVSADKAKALVEIKRGEDEFTPTYHLHFPKLEKGTVALLEEIKDEIIDQLKILPQELLNPQAIGNLRERFYEKCAELIKKKLPGIKKDDEEFLASILIHEMLGLGRLEFLIADGELEEIVVNNSKEPVWVYHKKYGWLKTNVYVQSEAEIANYASAIARRVGRQITTLHPLLDAHLVTGDRVNATLFPISTKGNTLTIRRFRRKPWTITDFIQNKTVTPEIAALLWLSIQYEMNMIISGGTASGKTSFLNSLMPFIPANQRIISIEDTREIQLPEFLHWVPLTTREANPEGKGEVSMLDLLVNSLRMRPDRIIVGEIRRGKEAEVLFEAMHTGHSVYATLHADTAEQTYRRLVNPPISVPEALLEALDLVVVMFRDRRKGIRRVYEVAEIVSKFIGSRITSEVRVMYRWNPSKDRMSQLKRSVKLIKKLKTFTGMSDREIRQDLKEKESILKWMVKNSINTVNAVGYLVSLYYQNPEKILSMVKKKKKASDLVPRYYLEG
ncbi:MAG: type II/IV secretion system ATPase subunit [Candidatus Aenigmarchaeota archaeon]|nr:type II/IV secretion system ATPase subunit [Candidatus Aenigmarchaeota archaeon]